MKAKDLRGKNIEDIEEGAEAPEEEDAVAAAYENISKKLDSIRNGKSEESDESKESEESGGLEEPELEEWKGPKPPSRDKDIEVEEEEIDIRKVKLHNLEDADDLEEPDESKESPLRQGSEGQADEDEELEEESEEKSPKEIKKEWSPPENDPLDQEEGQEEPNESEESKESQGDLEEEEPEGKIKDLDDDSEEEDLKDIKDESEMEEDNSRNTRTAVPETDLDEVESEMDAPERKAAQPDTLDDLAEVRGGRPMAGGADNEEEYYIPNLKGSRQEGGDLSYNTPPQREGLGQSYSPKGNYMDSNDPNNFFSAHQQPQAPKRANKFHLLVLVVIGVAVIGFTVYILKGGFGEISLTTQPSPSPSVAPTVAPTPTPTPAPEITKADFTVKVLNGTTTSGLAGKVRDKIKELSYKTATPGNNSDTDIAQTEVRVKEGTQSAALLQSLITDLAPDYSAKEGDKLDSKAAYDAEVIVGAK